MAIPSIKGLAFTSIVSDVKRLVEEGRLGKDSLEARLEREDLRILDEKIQAASWYPITSYARLGAILDEIEGEGRHEYFIERGARSAERIFAVGLYSQLERIDERAAEIQDGSSLRRLDIRLTLSMWNAMFNFTTWSYEPDSDDPNAFTCAVSGATNFPELLRWAAQGFLEYMFTRLSNAPVATSSERPNKDQILYSFELKRGAANLELK